MFGNLRLVATDKLSEYRANTDLFLELGNIAFADAIRTGTAKSSVNIYRTPWLLYHSWRQPRIQLDAGNAELVRDLMAGRVTGPAHEPIMEQIRQLGWCDDDQPVDLDELVKRTADYFLAIQNDYELRLFLERVRDLQPRVVVEIGTARGGMLFCFSQLAARDATLVSIDLPGAPNCGGQTAIEREVFRTFGPLTQSFHFIPDDSHLPSSKDKLENILAGRTIDLLFIDGDHSYEGCMADFEIYRHMVSPAGLIAFHDICLFPDQWPGTGVGVAWQEVKARYGGDEIIDPDGVTTPQLQPGQRWRWGIGVIEASRIPAEGHR
jgi:predicted O-methyltransferase YrrM